MAAIESLEKRGLNFKLIPGSEAESFENFAESTLTRFGLTQYQDVFAPILRNLHTSPNRELQVEKFFGIIKRLRSLKEYPDYLENLKASGVTFGIAEHFDPRGKTHGKVGGFIIPSTNQIFIDPIILADCSEDTVAEIITHESAHGGAFTARMPMLDESFTQNLTLNILNLLNYKPEFGAYESLMEELNDIQQGKNEYFKWTELHEIYSSFDLSSGKNLDGESQDKFYDFLALLASRDIDKYGISLFDEETFESKIREWIVKFIRLFPRLAMFINPDGTFIPQNENEVSTISFGQIFRQKLSDAVLKRIDSNDNLKDRITTTIQKDVHIEYVDLMESDLKEDPTNIYIRTEILSNIYKKYELLPFDFPISLLDIVNQYLRTNSSQLLEDYRRVYAPN